jgi:hypothetical protein
VLWPVAVLLAAGAAASPVAAQTADSPHSLRLGWEVGRFAYIERLDGERFMEETGALAGPVLAYRYRAPTGMRLFAEAGHWRGKVRYESDDGVLYNKDRLTSLRVGGAIPIEGTGAEVYAGYGYRRWFDGLGAHDCGYDRLTRYHYLPLGAAWRWTFGHQQVFARAEYDLFLYGHNTAQFKQVEASCGDSSFEGYAENGQLAQDDGWGVRLSAGTETRLSPGIQAGLALFFRHWRVGASSSDSVDCANPLSCDGGYETFYEPRNRTSFYGLRAFARFGPAEL